MQLWSRAFGIPVNVDFFGFNQVYQALLDEQSPFAANKLGVNVILVRLEDFACESYENFLEHLEQLLSAIDQFTRRTGRRLVVSTLPQPVSSFRHEVQGWVGLARAIWQKRLSEIPAVDLLDVAAVLENIGLSSAASIENDVRARMPYSPRVFQDMGIELARLIRSQRRPPAKVLALDCDGTLWGGAVAEVGLAGIHLSDDGEGRGYKMFQEYVLHLQKQGVLVVLASRNDESSVWEVFEQHPDMVLKKEHIAASRINWNPKSQNLRDMASQLNLSSSSFVYVDDDPVMQLEVSSNSPEVNVVPMPVDHARYGETLAKLWIFDSAQVTFEDQQRTQLMQQEEQRQNQQQSATSLKEYLHDLQLIVEMRFATEQDLPRVAQLTQKTNAFNLSLRRRSLDEIKSMKNAGFSILVLKAKDRFGDYGLIGLCIYRQEDHHIDSYEIDTFLLSCRALGRGVEESFLFGISTLLKDHGAKNLIAPFAIGPRNQPVRDFFHANGFVALSNETMVAETTRAFDLPEYVTWQSTCTAP